MGSKWQFEGVRVSSRSSIEISFYYAGRRCRERLKLEPSPANLRRAAQHRAAVLSAISEGTFDYAVTFPRSRNVRRFVRNTVARDLAENYLEGWLARKQTTLKASTFKDYERTVMGHLIPAFGALPLEELRRPVIRAWAASLTVSNKRISNLLSVLRAALQEAVDDELIESNPLHGWSYRNATPARERDDIDPFTASEQAAILAELTGPARNLIQFAWWTGLRTSELVALRWSDIDWTRQVFRVRRARTQAAHRDETTKTQAGLREVRLLPPALAALQCQRELVPSASATVFLNPAKGLPWKGDQAIRKSLWIPALQRAGVRYRRPYQTRHTYASMMLSAGEHPMWVAQQMGHADWGMIRRIYGRFMPDAEPDAGARAVAVFGGVRFFDPDKHYPE